MRDQGVDNTPVERALLSGLGLKALGPALSLPVRGNLDDLAEDPVSDLTPYPVRSGPLLP